MFFYSPLFWIFALPGLLLGIWAQMRVRGAFAKYSKVKTARDITGAQVARTLLDSQNLYDVAIEESQGGTLSDHYDPRARVLRLSPEVYRSPSVAAAGVAAHEMGHALQDARGYAPLKLRSSLVPAASIGSSLAPWIFIGGLFLRSLDTFLGQSIAWIGVVLFGVAVLFTLITLPVELDASKRAKKLLHSQGVLIGDEARGVDKVLDAAALTYVAAAVAAIGQLLYYVLLLTGGRRRS
jgi:Zn-dependent membrane protease YugP